MMTCNCGESDARPVQAFLIHSLNTFWREIHQFCLFAINFLAECGLALKLDFYETAFTQWELFTEFKQFSLCRQFNCYHLVQITAKFDN